MAEPVYQREGPGWIARIVSLALAGWLIWFFLEHSYRLRGGRGIVLPMVPLAVIWFPETAASICQEKVSPKMVTALGWAALFLLTIPLILVWAVNR